MSEEESGYAQLEKMLNQTDKRRRIYSMISTLLGLIAIVFLAFNQKTAGIFMLMVWYVCLLFMKQAEKSIHTLCGEFSGNGLSKFFGMLLFGFTCLVGIVH